VRRRRGACLFYNKVNGQMLLAWELAAKRAGGWPPCAYLQILEGGSEPRRPPLPSPPCRRFFVFDVLLRSGVPPVRGFVETASRGSHKQQSHLAVALRGAIMAPCLWGLYPPSAGLELVKGSQSVG
jgi:hypothetical protein